MPSFLSKVFGRKKGDEKESALPRSFRRISDASLLEGKFEAVPSTISPTSSKFPEDVHALDKGRDGPFGSLRSKSKLRPLSPTTDTPHLTLRLPGTVGKNEGSLVPSFNPQPTETDDSILTRRLAPAEALLLIGACSKAITERGGLETLGVMRPHWHSASPQLQHNLISLFILSLAQKSPGTTLAPSTSPSAAFNSELEYTRSVHDIAAVFRWALRHLKLEGTSFGSSSPSEEWTWYNNFSEAERRSNYHPQFFTAKLVPEIPSTHIALIIPILDIISSLAAHAEANGYSGSKLTKYFGFWLLTARRASGTEDWNSFYTRWETSGRMLEHLFLSRLRDEDTRLPLPKRLQELVAQYPYTASPGPTADGLLTRPRFSTRRHDALFVRVEAVYADGVQIQSSRSPIGIFNDALKSEPKSESGRYAHLWDQVKSVVVASDSEDKPLPAILSDDTINLLSLVSTDPKEQVLLGISGATSNLVSPLSPLSPVTETFLSPITNGNGTSVPVRKPTLLSNPPQSPKDWAEFSSAGFGETTLSQNFASTLLDKDVEVTVPPVQRKPSKQKQNKIPVTPVESNPPSPNPKAAPEEPEGPKLALVATEIVQLDEAFVDFWRDAVADPISGDWPKFVIGELKRPLTHPSSEDGEKSPISWIIIEEKFRKTTPPPTPVISHEALSISGGLKATPAPLKRTSSPRPSFGEKKSSSLSATLKRFSLFGGSRDDLSEDVSSTASGSGKKDSFSGKKKRTGLGKSPKIGEMGEVLSEEPEPLPELPKKVDEPKKVEKVEQNGEAKDKVVAVGGVVLTNAAGSDEGKVEAVKDVPLKEQAKQGVVKADATTKDDELPAPPQDDPPVVDEPALEPVSEPQPTPASLPPSASEETPTSEESNAPVPKETEPETLPPAPQSVISHGGTPGPQLALDSTEAGLHHPLEPETYVEPAGAPPVDVAENPADFVTAHLEDKVETEVGVDLEPVPIVGEPEGEEVKESNDSTTEVPEPEQVVTEDVLPLPSNIPVSEELDEPEPTKASTTSQAATTDDVPQPTGTDPHPPTEEPTEVQEAV